MINPYPHEPACPDCRQAKRCNYCGDYANNRCTNGRCMVCHPKICSGKTHEEHGFGTAPHTRHYRVTE